MKDENLQYISMNNKGFKFNRVSVFEQQNTKKWKTIWRMQKKLSMKFYKFK